ncbi:MAG: enterotoxin [bacterium]|nr:enterotoxin [bacterium]
MMNQRLGVLGVMLLAGLAGGAGAVEFPGPPPGKAASQKKDGELTLQNNLLRLVWKTADGKMRLTEAVSIAKPQAAGIKGAEMFRIRLNDGRGIGASQMTLLGPVAVEKIKAQPDAERAEDRFGGWRITGQFEAKNPEMKVEWSASLRDGSNYATASVKLTAGAKGLALKELIVLDMVSAGAKVHGTVLGSPVTSGRWFMACEHPLANNRVESDRVIGGRARGSLKPGQAMELTSVVGLTPPGQLRRGFLYYLERRRAHSYRPFLHYNSWYHLNIGRKDNHMTEAECLDTIEHIGRELVKKRRTKLDAFVWDDGWDNFNSLWEFHKDFPNGFTTLQKAATKYRAAQGVWMSPWGGYGGTKKKRIAYGQSQGYETNDKGFSMSGPKYRAAFRDVCLRMMRRHGVMFFKFDGMGGGNMVGGAKGKRADDIDAVLDLTGTLRKTNPHVFISATVGTWPSPFWTFYADSIWRQGGDTGFSGAGNSRQRWITYRDMHAYRNIRQRAPLYPFNSLMLHGLCVGERSNPAKMTRDEKSVSNEIWTFFGSGTGLQELYISPKLLTKAMWDELAAAAKWSRTNSDILVDTHWIGGDPGKAQVYGFASWQRRKGIIVLRNPSNKPASYSLDLVRDLELPDGQLKDYDLKPVIRGQRVGRLLAPAVKPVPIKMLPFEVLVFEATAAPDGKTYDADTYRKARQGRRRQGRPSHRRCQGLRGRLAVQL